MATANDPANIVKYDLQNGTWSNYTSGPPTIKIQNADKFEGGNEHIILRDQRRDYEQTVAGTVLDGASGKFCAIEIFAKDDSIRDNIYDDVIDILTSTSRSYKLLRNDELSRHVSNFRSVIEVRFLRT